MKKIVTNRENITYEFEMTEFQELLNIDPEDRPIILRTRYGASKDTVVITTYKPS